MFGLGHLPEILLILFVGLLIFGPKRLIDMGSALGKAVRELRESTKDMNWSALLGSNENTNRAPTTLGALSQFTQTLTSGLKDPSAGANATATTPAPGQTTVESAPSKEPGSGAAVEDVKEDTVD
jgi:sec-independent protein translocase protein TatA